MNKRTAYINSQFKVRESEDAQDLILSGYFIKFDEETEIWDGYFEKIDRSAIDKSINDLDIRALFNHDTSLVLGRTTNKTLNLTVEDTGVKGEILINKDDPMAVGVFARVKRGDISGCSFGFIPTEIDTIRREDSTLDIIKGLELLEVSPCTFPAYPQTEISARKKEFVDNKKQRLEQRKRQFKEKYNNG